MQRRGTPYCGGASLVEVMVGVVVALVSILAVQRVFVASETAKHHGQSDGDAQQAALFALARLSFDAANAGAGIASAAGVLATCPVTADMAAVTWPVAVVVTDGGSADAPDSLVVRYAVGNRAATPATLTAAAPSGAASSSTIRWPSRRVTRRSPSTASELARVPITSVRNAGQGWRSSVTTSLQRTCPRARVRQSRAGALGRRHALRRLRRRAAHHRSQWRRRAEPLAST